MIFNGKDGTVGHFRTGTCCRRNHDQAAAAFKMLCAVCVLKERTFIETEDVHTLRSVHVASAAHADDHITFFLYEDVVCFFYRGELRVRRYFVINDIRDIFIFQAVLYLIHRTCSDHAGICDDESFCCAHELR